MGNVLRLETKMEMSQSPRNAKTAISSHVPCSVYMDPRGHALPPPADSVKACSIQQHNLQMKDMTGSNLQLQRGNKEEMYMLLNARSMPET